MHCPGHPESTDWHALQPSQEACVSEDLKFEELEALPAGRKSRTAHDDLLEERGADKRQRSTTCRERTRKGPCKSDHHWNCLKGSTRETSESLETRDERRGA